MIVVQIGKIKILKKCIKYNLNMKIKIFINKSIIYEIKTFYI